MSRGLLFCVGLLSAVLLCGCEDDVFQRMRRQPKFKAYSENPLFGDRRAMRAPPEGAVPWERRGVRVEEEVWHDAQGYVTRIPVPVTREMLARGRKHFDIYCATCHGYVGDGVSPVANNMGLRPPPSIHIHREDPPGFYFEVITLGRGLMGSYASEIPSPADRWAVVAYVQALKKSQAARVADLSAEARQKLQEAAP